MRDLLEVYNLIIDEKASFEDYMELINRLSVSAIGPDAHLALLKEQRKESKGK